MSEIKGRARKELIELIYPFVAGTYGGVDWGKLMDITEATVDKIFSKEYIAIVDRKMATPFSINENISLLEKVREGLDMPIMTPEYQVLSYLINVIKAGWVEEIK